MTKMSLKAIRVNANMSQKQAAKALGVSADTLYKWESGKSFPNVPSILKIEKVYGVGFDDIDFLPNVTIKS